MPLQNLYGIGKLNIRSKPNSILKVLFRSNINFQFRFNEMMNVILHLKMTFKMMLILIICCLNLSNTRGENIVH